MKKTLSLLLALVICLGMLTACGSSEPAEEDSAAVTEAVKEETVLEVEAAAVPEGKTDLVVGGFTDTTSFDPLSETNNTSIMIGLCVFDNLFTLNDDGGFNYQLAENAEWVENDGAWSVVITLKPGIKFHSGDELSCEDVLFTLQRMSDNFMYSSRVSAADFDEAVIDGNTLTIPMHRYDARFLPNLTSELGYILNKSYVEEVGDEKAFQQPDGTGPYVFTKWVTNESVTLTRNEEYWGDAGAFETIVYKFFSDDNTRVLEFEAGNLDICAVESGENLDSLAAGDYEGCGLYTWLTNKMGMLFFNNSTESSPFYENPALRKAVAAAIDLEAIVESMGGSTTVAATSSLPTSAAAYAEHLNVYDPELAKQYLEEAGYPNGFSFTFMVASDQGSNLKMAEAIQAYLSQVGIEMTIEPLDLGTLMGYQMSGEQVCGIVDNTIRGDDYEMYQNQELGSGNKLTEIHNDDYQALLSSILSERDHDTRIKLFQEIQDMVYDQCYFVPLYQNRGAWAYQDYVTGLDENGVLTAEKIVDFAALGFVK